MLTTKDEYVRALDAACREWEELAQRRAGLDKRLSRLHETIAALTRLCGYTPTVPWGMTDAIRVLLHRAEAPMTAVDVRERLRTIGFDLSKYANDLAVIHTVLKRLTKAGEVHLVSREPGTHTYQWARVGTFVFDQPHAHVPFDTFFTGQSTSTRRKKP